MTDINKLLVSKRETQGEKAYLNTLLDIMIMMTLHQVCVKLPQMIGYAKYFDNNIIISFKVIDKNLLKKYTKIWETAV